MKLRPAPKLSTCIISYYVVLVVFGIVWPLLVLGTIDVGFHRIISSALAILLYTHYFFIMAPQIQDDWLSYLMLVGIPIAIVVACLKLSGWPRNLVVVGLLFAAHFYGLMVAGING